MSIVRYTSPNHDSIQANQVVYYDPNDGLLVLHNHESNKILLLSDITHSGKRNGYEFESMDRSNDCQHHRCPNCGFSWNSFDGRATDRQSYKRQRLSNDPIKMMYAYQESEPGRIFLQYIRPDYFKLLGQLPDTRYQTDCHFLDDVSHSIPPPLEIYNQDYFKRFFSKETPYVLGSGAHAQVFKVSHVLNGVKLGTYAVKRINVGCNFELIKEVLNEVLILYELSSKGANEHNLIRYNHVWLELGEADELGTFVIPPQDPELSLKTSSRIPYVYILQQYCAGGHLEELIVKNYRPSQTLKEKVENERNRRRQIRTFSNHNDSVNRSKKWLHPLEILKFFTDVTRGVHYLHTNGILHRDLKPSNCLLDNVYIATLISGNNHRDTDLDQLPSVLVSDFGEGLILKHKEQSEYNVNGKNLPGSQDRQGNTGTLEYTAPGLWEYKQVDVTLNGETLHSLNDFTFESDIYLLGLILCFLCVGELPFTIPAIDECDPQQIRFQILSWFNSLTRDGFGTWFKNASASIIKDSNVHSVIYTQFEDLIYNMIKSTGLSKSTVANIESMGALNVLQNLASISNTLKNYSNVEYLNINKERRTNTLNKDAGVKKARYTRNHSHVKPRNPIRVLNVSRSRFVCSAWCLLNFILLEVRSYRRHSIASSFVKACIFTGTIVCIVVEGTHVALGIGFGTSLATLVIVGLEL